MKTKNLMSSPAVTVHPHDRLAHAAALMWQNDCGALPVVDEHERPVGVLSLSDLGRRGDKDPQLGKRALQVMAAVCRLRNEAAPPAQRTMQAAAQAVAT
jgi:CBS domain-containing protein